MRSFQHYSIRYQLAAVARPQPPDLFKADDEAALARIQAAFVSAIDGLQPGPALPGAAWKCMRNARM